MYSGAYIEKRVYKYHSCVKYVKMGGVHTVLVEHKLV